ncbi:hypothetical protein F0562_010131 [Nyssa sinensis]|uniref:Uncharacterized protein n=1 Tax=Nyssa sinensis TaxID=561372 RepID=A0A5J5A182_9ASTE|nr:hypothetical protein F0562_010131 [Nyssa sinensis]
MVKEGPVLLFDTVVLDGNNTVTNQFLLQLQFFGSLLVSLALVTVQYMSSQIETVEERLKSFLGQLLTECGILYRIMVGPMLKAANIQHAFFSLSQNEHSVKLTQEGFEVFREYYPANEEEITLEFVWETDEFVLFERINKNEIKNRDKDLGDVSLGASAMCIEALLEVSLIKDDDGMNFEHSVEVEVEVEDDSGVAGSISQQVPSSRKWLSCSSKFASKLLVWIL